VLILLFIGSVVLREQGWAREPRAFNQNRERNQTKKEEKKTKYQEEIEKEKEKEKNPFD
jgi:hypothetical protein